MYFLHLVLTFTPHYIIMVKGLLVLAGVRNDIEKCHFLMLLENNLVFAYIILYDFYTGHQIYTYTSLDNRLSA